VAQSSKVAVAAQQEIAEGKVLRARDAEEPGL
jgi:hypothetical protein